VEKTIMRANVQFVTIETDLGTMGVNVEIWREDDGIQAVVNGAYLEALPRFNVADAMPDDMIDQAIDLAADQWQYDSE
jgi:hypothetical protein